MQNLSINTFDRGLEEAAIIAYVV